MARFLGREKRFTVHAELPDGRVVAAHTNNTGRMTGCSTPGARCWLEPATSPRRKLPWSLRIVEARARPGRGGTPDQADQAAPPAPSAPSAPSALSDPADQAGLADQAAPPGHVSGGSCAQDRPAAIPLHHPAPAPGHVLVGVDTAAPSSLVATAVAREMVTVLAGCRLVRREVPYPAAVAAGSRVDLLLAAADGTPVWVEIKNVTWVESGLALFPDAPTVRGRKHLADLAASVAAGDRAALVFCVQRGDAGAVAAAESVDPDYARALATATAAGVLVAGLAVTVTPEGVSPAGPLPVVVR